MVNGRLIALVLIAAAVVAVVAFSHLSAGGGTPSPSTAGVPPGPAEGTVLSTDRLIDFWRQRVDRNPGDYLSLTELAANFLRRARETGDVESYSGAEAALARALELNPRYETAISYLATVRFAKHDFAGARDTAHRVYSLNSGAAQALAVLGDASLELGDYDGAASAYDRLLKLSESPPVYSRRARLAELNGRPQEAIELLARAAREADASAASQESRAWYRSQLGRLYFNVGDLGAAQAQYQRSLEAFPDYVHGLAGLARVRAARGDYEGAIALYRRVVERYPVPEYVIALGDVYRAAGQPDEAARQYELVEAINRLYQANGVNTDLEMALFFADHNLRLEEALGQAQAEYQRRPSVQAADVLAWALYRSGRYDDALKYSREALRLGSQDPLMLFHSGMIHYRLGDSERAREYLGGALEINPAFSVLYAETAAETFRQLQAAVRR